jgi:hypothetical protein
MFNPEYARVPEHLKEANQRYLELFADLAAKNGDHRQAEHLRKMIENHEDRYSKIWQL